MREDGVSLKNLLALLALLSTLVLASNGYLFSAIKEQGKDFKGHLLTGSHLSTEIQLAKIQTTLEDLTKRVEELKQKR